MLRVFHGAFDVGFLRVENPVTPAVLPLFFVSKVGEKAYHGLVVPHAVLKFVSELTGTESVRTHAVSAAIRPKFRRATFI
jgi:hypothetical protein